MPGQRHCAKQALHRVEQAALHPGGLDFRRVAQPALYPEADRQNDSTAHRVAAGMAEFAEAAVSALVDMVCAGRTFLA